MQLTKQLIMNAGCLVCIQVYKDVEAHCEIFKQPVITIIWFTLFTLRFNLIGFIIQGSKPNFGMPRVWEQTGKRKSNYLRQVDSDFWQYLSLLYLQNWVFRRERKPPNPPK